MNLRRALLWLALGAALVAPAATFAQPSAPPQPLDYRSDPVLMVASYYNAISLGDYERAYLYWEGAPNGRSFEEFVGGFTETSRVAAYLAIPVFEYFDGGNVFARVPILLAVEHRDGSRHTFAGCMRARNVTATNGSRATAPAADWRLQTGTISAYDVFDLSLLDTACPPPFDGTDFPYTNRNSPAEVLGAYVDAVSKHDYARAYHYWSTPLGPTFADFAAGFRDTEQARVVMRADVTLEGAAGSVYARIPALIAEQTGDGSSTYYGGCFVARKSNVPTEATAQPPPAWWLSDARLSALGPAQLNDGLALLDGACAALQADA
jgi:hypothetical protein